MAEGKLLKAWGAGCAWQFIIAIGIMLAMFGGIACLAALVSLAPVSEDMQMVLGLGGFVLLIFVMLGGIAVWAVWTIRKRASKLDEIFLPLGLSGRGYLTNGRQYHGLVRGRQVDVYFYRGPALDIYVAAPLRTRVGIGLKSSLSRMAAGLTRRTPLETGDPALAELAIYPSDPQWCAALLSDMQVKRILPRLMADQCSFELRNLILQPEAVQLNMHHIMVRQITPEAVQRWLNDLLELAQIAERLPSPGKIETASALEQRNRLNRSSYTLPVVLITLAAIGVMALCAIGVTAAMLLLSQPGF
jgi:hypothetical protein